jgi:uncharacterized protein (TIGR02284 family)
MATHAGTVKLLNRLTVKLLDSAQAYSMAANDASEFAFYAAFKRRAAERTAAARRFQRVLASQRRRQPLTGSLLGIIELFIAHLIHRSTTAELTVIKLFDWQESRVTRLFEKLRTHTDLPTEVRAVVDSEYKRVSDGYAALKALKQHIGIAA